jgi:hypothetical protein
VIVIDKSSNLIRYGMEQHILAFSLIIEGATEKVLKFIVTLKSIYNKTISFNDIL